MKEAKTSPETLSGYSDTYKAIRKAAETTWPAWKVSVYNTSVATSAHARKIEPTTR